MTLSRDIGDDATADAALAKNRGNIVVTVPAQDRILELGALHGEALATEIETKCKNVLTNQRNLQSKGNVKADPVRLAQQLGAAIRGFLQLDTFMTFAARRTIRVRDPEKYAKFQRERTPFIKTTKKQLKAQVESKEYQAFLAKIEDRAEVRRRKRIDKEWVKWIEGRRISEPEKLSDAALRRSVRTSRIRSYNTAIVETGVKDDSVVSFQFTTQRDGLVCVICRDYDLWVVKKGDDALAFKTPPLHPN